MSASVVAELDLFERLSQWFGALFGSPPQRRAAVKAAPLERQPLSRTQPDIIAILSRYGAAQQAAAAEVVARAALASFEFPDDADAEAEAIEPAGRTATLAQRMATVASLNRPFTCDRTCQLSVAKSSKPKRRAAPRRVARNKSLAGIAAARVARPAVHEPYAKPAASAAVIDLGAERRARRVLARAA